MTDERGIRVLVVDDHAIARAGLRMLLGAEPDMEVVGEAADGSEAVDMVATAEVDVVVMDVRMPRLDGIEATRRMAALPRPPAVLVITTFDVDDHVLAALGAGAAGFLVKDCDPQQLVDGVRVLARGGMVLDPGGVRRLVDAALRGAPTERTPDPLLERMTAREREVFEAVARGLSNSDIARVMHLSEHTVKSHVGNVFGKLGFTGRVQAVIAAYEWGVVRPQP